MSTTLTLKEAQDQFARLFELAGQGHEVIIGDSETGLARLTAIIEPHPQGPRIPGIHEGEIWTSDDFDAPLPDSFWLGEKEE